MRETIALALAALVFVGTMVGISASIEREPTAWEKCGVSWSEMLGDPAIRSECNR